MSEEFPVFGIGTTLACFHCVGKTPVLIKRLKISVSTGEVEVEVSFSIFGETLSGPEDLFTLRLDSKVST